MRRDLDLVREILLKLEASEGPLDVNKLVSDNRSANLVAYHFKIMAQGGLIEANNVEEHQSFMAEALSLTWGGHEYLDALKSDTVWQKVKKMLKEHGGDIPYAVVKKAAVAFLEQKISSEIGLPFA